MRSTTLLFTLTLFACKGAEDSEETDVVETDETDVAATSFATDVWPILETNCAGCHTDDAWHPGFKISDAATAYTSLMTDAPDKTDAGFTKYVVAGDAGASLVVHKVSEATPSYGGVQMPQGKTPLSDADQAIIAAWIEEGAADN